MRSLVIIPTYNEKDNVERMIRKVLSLKYNFHLLIIDDASPDKTADVVKELQNEYPDRLFLEERSGKLGLGTAYIHGFKWALNRHYELIYEMDCDFSHNPKDLIKMQDIMDSQKNIDVVVGSRYITGVNVVNWPMKRVLMSYFASYYCRLITRVPIRDYTAGFICYRRKVLQTIDLDNIKFIGYAFQIEMKFSSVKHGFNIKEMPIIFTDRTAGVSKMNGKIFKEAVFGVIYLKLKSLFRKYKQAR